MVRSKTTTLKEEFIEFARGVLQRYEIQSAVRMIVSRYYNCIHYEKVEMERGDKMAERYVTEYKKKYRKSWTINEYVPRVTILEIGDRLIFHIIEWRN